MKPLSRNGCPGFCPSAIARDSSSDHMRLGHAMTNALTVFVYFIELLHFVSLIPAQTSSFDMGCSTCSQSTFFAARPAEKPQNQPGICVLYLYFLLVAFAHS
jgi:hypothetical protein